MLIGFVALVSAAFTIFWQREHTEINDKSTSLQEGNISSESLSTISKKEVQIQAEEEDVKGESIDKESVPHTQEAEISTPSSTVNTLSQQEEKQQATNNPKR